MFLSDINKGEIFTNLLQSLNERAERGTFPELSLLSNSRKGREKSHDVIAQNTSGPGARFSKAPLTFRARKTNIQIEI